jgi:hypothetical protein
MPPARAQLTIIRIDDLREIERLPGWHGRYFHTEHMTVAHYRFARGASIHEHFHPQEEVYQVLEGELEITIDGCRKYGISGSRGYRAVRRESFGSSFDRRTIAHRRLPAPP